MNMHTGQRPLPRFLGSGAWTLGLIGVGAVLAVVGLSRQPRTSAFQPTSAPVVPAKAGVPGRPAVGMPPPMAPASTQPVRVATTQPPGLEKISPFLGETLSGNGLAFPEDYRGKIVLLTFWATWCPHCKAELPFWKSAWEKYHDRGFDILGIPTDRNRGRSADLVRQQIAENGIPWEQVYEQASELSQWYGASTIPTSFLIDGTTGQILAQGRAVRRAGLEREIEKALAARAAASQPSSQPGH